MFRVAMQIFMQRIILFVKRALIGVDVNRFPAIHAAREPEHY
jgi:hypothetical protein